MKIKSQKLKQKRKNGQVWISDLTLSILLFSLTAIIAFKIIANSSLSDTGFDSVKTDAAKISDYLVNEGVPTTWTESNVVRLGFMSGLRIDPAKVYDAMNISNSNYELAKTLLNTQNDFLVVFEYNDSNLVSFNNYCSFGKANLTIMNVSILNETECYGVNFSSENINNVARVERIVLLNSTIKRMKVYVWN